MFESLAGSCPSSFPNHAFFQDVVVQEYIFFDAFLLNRSDGGLDRFIREFNEKTTAAQHWNRKLPRFPVLTCNTFSSLDQFDVLVTLRLAAASTTAGSPLS